MLQSKIGEKKQMNLFDNISVYRNKHEFPSTNDNIDLWWRTERMINHVHDTIFCLDVWQQERGDVVQVYTSI